MKAFFGLNRSKSPASYDARMDTAVAYRFYNDSGECGRCGVAWKHVNGHTTFYGDKRNGCFPLCVRCWQELTPVQRLPHYRVLYDKWEFDAKRSGYELEKDWGEIEAAVLAGN